MPVAALQLQIQLQSTNVFCSLRSLAHETSLDPWSIQAPFTILFHSVSVPGFIYFHTIFGLVTLQQPFSPNG